MTTLVRGPIKLVTDRPDTVRKVSIRAPELRLHGAGIVTDHNDDIPVVGGQVEFEALPGPAVLTLVTAGGAPLRSVDIVVPDEDTATLSECLDQIYVYEPPVVGRAQQFAREAGEHATTAQEIATNLPATIQNELDDRVPEALSADQTIRDAATLAVNDAVDAGLPGKADTSYVDAQDQALGKRIDGLHHYQGTGFPEGKVSAPVGATYTDTAATNGAVRWIKTQGTGNTGWQVEYGDTGWRDVSSSITDRMSPLEFTDGARLLIRRIGDLAYLKISGRVYVRNQFGKLCDSFNGFRPENYAQVNFSKAADINSGVWQIRVESGTVDGSITSGADRSAMGYWDVSQRWPSTLPGVPA